MAQTAIQILKPLKLDVSIDTATDQEEMVDAAIDQLNLAGAPTIPNMAGTVGAKTVTLTSKQRGAVLFVARAVYASYNKNPEATSSDSTGQASLSQMDMMSNSNVLNAIQTAAKNLRDDGTLPFVIFNEIEMIEEST